ncbi:pheromone-regulated protein prm10, partial [Spiromyces aspiralis]
MTTLSTLPIAAAPTIALRQDGAGLRWRAEGSRCATLDSLATSDQCHSNNPNNTSNSDNVNNNNSSSSGSSSDDDRDVLEMAMRPASIKLGSTKPTNYGNAVSDLGSSNGRCSGHDLYQTSGVVNEQRQRAVQFQDMVSLAVHSINRVANLDQAESARATGDSPIDSNGTYTATAKEARAIRAAAMASPGPFGSVFPASDDSGGNDKSPSQLYDFEKGMADTSAANLPSVDHSSLFRHKQMMRRRQQQRRRPGLLSHYLRLGQLSNRLRIRDALGLDHDDYYPTTDDETVVQSHQMDTGRGDASVPPALSPRSREWGPQFRRRRRRPGQSLRPVTAGNRWLHLFRRRTRSVPNNLAANTDQQRAGISPPQPYERPSLMFRPFERLTGALPYVGSSRQLAAAAAIASKSSAPQTTTATAFGTPLVTVGRRPLPSGAGTPLPPPPSDQLTTEKFGATAAGGGSGVGGDYFGIQHHDNPLSASPSAMQIALEQAAIEDAIRMLLLHQRFVILLAKAFMMYGSPLHHMESNLSRMADFLDLEASFSVLPGMIIISFDDSITHTSETKIIRCQNGWDMHRMHLTNK